MVGYMMTPSSFLVITMKIIGTVLTSNTYHKILESKA